MKKILIMIFIFALSGCAGANVSWINYCQRNFLKPVTSSDGQILYYKQNNLDGNPSWAKDFNGCLKYGHEARGLNYSKSMWQVEEMCYKHEKCILAVYECLENRGYVRIKNQ